MMKKLSIAAAVMSALLAAGCSNGDNEQKVTSESEKAQAVATTDEAQSSTESSDVTASNPSLKIGIRLMAFRLLIKLKMSISSQHLKKPLRRFVPRSKLLRTTRKSLLSLIPLKRWNTMASY